ncbi:MAG: serine/threonine-protein kinase [Myxococcota bacterium]
MAGKYRLRKPLGRGANGLIWEAEQEPIGRRVAVKLCVVAHQREPDDVKRFRRGAIAMARMAHPNIVTVHDFGEVEGPEGPELYLVMERLEGVSLARFVQRGPMPPPRARSAIAQLLGALHQVHERGYVHRDVKPANLAVTAIDDDPFVVKLLDFGIARSVDSLLKPADVVAAERRRGSRVTQPLRILGTPEYMAPEQILDLALEPRTDLYAAAVVLWQLLVGKAPYSFDERRETYAAHLRAPIPRLESVIAPGVLSELAPWQAFFERALAKTSKKRFEDATEMRAELRALPL